jgi:hypothetical protein
MLKAMKCNLFLIGDCCLTIVVLICFWHADLDLVRLIIIFPIIILFLFLVFFTNRYCFKKKVKNGKTDIRI